MPYLDVAPDLVSVFPKLVLPRAHFGRYVSFRILCKFESIVVNVEKNYFSIYVGVVKIPL